MRGLRLFIEFASWRWSPTVALIGGTLLYILFVLLVIPSEIGLPGMNTKFVPRSSHGSSSGSDAGSPFSLSGAKDTAASPISTGESEPPPPPTPAAIPPHAPGNFGSRGFSPPLPREEPPPPPVPPPPPEAAQPPPPAPEPPPPAVTSTAEAAVPPPAPEATGVVPDAPPPAEPQ